MTIKYDPVRGRFVEANREFVLVEKNNFLCPALMWKDKTERKVKVTSF